MSDRKRESMPENKMMSYTMSEHLATMKLDTMSDRMLESMSHGMPNKMSNIPDASPNHILTIY